MTTIRLKPKSTRIYENEQWIRTKPNELDGSLVDNQGLTVNVLNQAGLAETDSSGTWTREIKRPKINSLPIVGSVLGTGDDIGGEQLGNKTFALRAGSDPQVPDYAAVLFVDVDDSIIGGGGDGTITINYDDDTDTARVDSWQLSVAGKGPHKTTYKVKSTTSVVGTGFDTVGGGAPGSTDVLIVGMAIPDDLTVMLSSVLRWGQGPSGDPNVGSLSNQMAYAESDDTSDASIYVTTKPLPAGFTTPITNVTINWYTKLMGASAAGGIDLVIKIGTGAPWIVGNNSTVDAETAPGELDIANMSINPATGNAWTRDDWNNLKVGVIFRGDSPGVAKRWCALRIQYNGYSGFVHPTIDGEDPTNLTQAHEAVNDDPFGTPDDDAYVVMYQDQLDVIAFHYDYIPDEATSIISVEPVIRWTMLNVGEKNSSGENDWPCGVYNDPKGGDESRHYMLGPLEQSNSGGNQLQFSSFPGSLIGTRYFANRGDPADGCGPFKDTVAGQEGDGYGDFIVRSWKRTTNSSGNPISVSDYNNTNFQFGLRGGGSRDHETRVSHTYCDIEYYRSPTGGTYLHLVIDDDIDSPDDSSFMRSQHTANKKFGVDFAGIPEVTAINSVKVKVRAKNVEGVKGKISAGWRIVWRLGDDSGTDVNETIQNSIFRFETFEFVRSLSPFTGLNWTREEVNNLVVIWETIGENDYVEKQLSALNLEVDLDLIPDKIDAARDIVSRKLRLLRKPQPFLELSLPPEFADLRVLDDLLVLHNAIPRTAETLGFEDWDRSMMRVFRKRLDMNKDEVVLTLLDLREFLTTLWITGTTKAPGQATEGMAVLTPGVSLNFTRPTNDYLRDDFAGLFNELKGDVAPSGLKGILVQNGAMNRVVNSAFSEGATDVFTGWTKVVGAGGSIVEDPDDNIFSEDIVGNAPRSVLITTPTVAADASYLLRDDVSIDRGDSPYVPQGSDYAIKIIHKDDDGYPLHVAFDLDPPGFGNYGFNLVGDWVGTTYPTSPFWHELPVRSEVTEELFHYSLSRLEVIPSSPAQDTHDIRVRIAGRTFSGARNHLYGVHIEGGRFASDEDRRYAGNFILTRNGPVVRDALSFFIQNNRERPIYPAEGRGTFGIEVEPIWDSSTSPRVDGRKRYVFGMIVDSGNFDELYYDFDSESFVYRRSVAGNVVSTSIFYPQVTKDEPIQLAVRWISADGDLGLTPFTITIFADGVEGSSAVASQRMTLSSDALLYLGSRDGTDGEMIDAWIRRLEIKQFALTADGIRRLFT